MSVNHLEQSEFNLRADHVRTDRRAADNTGFRQVG